MRTEDREGLFGPVRWTRVRLKWILGGKENGGGPVQAGTVGGSATWAKSCERTTDKTNTVSLSFSGARKLSPASNASREANEPTAVSQSKTPTYPSAFLRHTLGSTACLFFLHLRRDLRQNPHRETRIATESEFDALRESVVAIRQRLFHLETAMSAFVPELRTDGVRFYAYKPGSAPPGNGFEPEMDGVAGASEMKTSSSAGGSAEGSQDREPAPDTDGDVEAAVALEFLVSNLLPASGRGQ